MPRLPVLALCTTALVPSLAAAQAPTWSELLSPDALIHRLIQSGIVALRSEIDITFDAISSRDFGRAISLTGIEGFAFPDHGQDCDFAVDQVSVTTAPWTDLATLSLNVNALGVSMLGTCLPPDISDTLTELGFETLDFQHALITLDYDIPSAGLQMSATLTNDALAQVDMNATFDYAALEGLDDDPNPVLFLTKADLRVTDFGAWEIAKGFLPPMFTTPAAVPAIVGEARNALTNAGPEPLTEAETAALASMETALTAFLNGDTSLSLTLSPPDPTFVDFEEIEQSPLDMIEAYHPLLTTEPIPAIRLVSQNVLAQVVSSDLSQLSDGQLAGLARALLSGLGVPRNLARATETTVELLRRDPTAAPGIVADLANAWITQDPNSALTFARHAAAQGSTAAVGVLDRLESGLALDAILVQQGGSGTPVVPESLAQLRDMALAHHTGLGADRSYELALVYALVLNAAHDSTGGALMRSLYDRFGRDPAWPAFRARAENTALDLWTSNALGSALGAAKQR
ncbi:hypothetical protein [Pseudaestuariivita sp.]|uniref:hypothetical protein n=1 Tax=Pseudaestuariivita sp. TaxID=2211669 RepID=UPI004058C286